MICVLQGHKGWPASVLCYVVYMICVLQGYTGWAACVLCVVVYMICVFRDRRVGQQVHSVMLYKLLVINIFDRLMALYKWLFGNMTRAAGLGLYCKHLLYSEI
jgi:hypothetical protein